MPYVADHPIFEPPLALPRGPHRLTREQVSRSQRTRLMAAFTGLLAERGYAGVTIGLLAARAAVSRAVFYEHFADKEACMLAAYDHFAEAVAEAISPQPGDGASWSDFIAASISGYIGLLDRDPTAARAFIVEMDAAGPTARRRRREAIHAFAGLLAQRHAAIRARNPSLGPIPEPVYLALTLAVRELVHESLATEPGAPLRRLLPDLRFLLTAVVEGAPASR
jgi:AcrR family transcriptional regulator